MILDSTNRPLRSLRAFAACSGAWALGLILAGATSTALGGAIYNIGVPSLSPVLGQGASFADVGSSFSEAADVFSLKFGQTTNQNVQGWGVNGEDPSSKPARDCSINIYDGNVATPATLHANVTIVGLTRLATASASSGFTMNRYDIVIADLTVPAATAFWLGIADHSSGNRWAWVTSASSNGNARQFSSANQTWSATSKELAFN